MSLFEWTRHLFVPHHGNNHHAKILHPGYLSVIVGIFLTSQFFLSFFTLVSPSVLGFASDIRTERLLEVVNQRRAENGAGTVKLNAKLNEVAARKAGDMFAFNYWAHTSPSGRDPWSFFKEVGYNYLYAGENLARDFMDSDSVVAAWMNSPSHRDNLINKNYQEMGLAIVNGTLNGVETTLVVQVFGTQKTPVTAKKAPVLKKPSLGTSAAVKNIQEKSKFVLAQASGEEVEIATWLSPFAITKTISIFFLGIIFGALALDLTYVVRKKTIRLTGKNVAHLIFVGLLLLVVFSTQSGKIL